VTEARAEQTAEAREALHDHFSDGQVLRLTLAVAAINAWNRIAGPLRFTPPPAE
jgi:alkylhydroperoxidase family enzyme